MFCGLTFQRRGWEADDEYIFVSGRTVPLILVNTVFTYLWSKKLAFQHAVEES